jgi:SAM-dependent methyltransferase
VFADIYRHGTWGKSAEGAGTSGTGSTVRRTVIYRTFLQRFIKENDIRSVVDAGCGDWEFSQTLDWTGIDYKGFDIVESNIANHSRKHSKPNIQFLLGNVVELDLPPADLLICKHVLQHLPTRDVQTFLTQVTKYKHVLLTNSVNEKTLSATNGDIVVGGYRELDPTARPFNLRGTKVLTYWDGYNMHQVVHAGARTSDEPALRPIEGTNSFTERDVRARLKAGGFSEVTDLKLGKKGIWLGKAQKDQRPVAVAVDIQGNVFHRSAS